MRYLTAACPEIRRVLLVESGSRTVLETAIGKLRYTFGSGLVFDLVTCRPGEPAGLTPDSRIWRTQDYKPVSRKAMVQEIVARGPTVMAMLCSQEPVMLRWKWWLAWKLPVKILIVNENGDCFWLDTAHLRTLRKFVAQRTGLSGGLGIRRLGYLAALPFTVLYLLLYATAVHGRRLWRRAVTGPTS